MSIGCGANQSHYSQLKALSAEQIHISKQILFKLAFFQTQMIFRKIIVFKCIAQNENEVSQATFLKQTENFLQ
jgi:hypothetical protein